MNLELPEGFDSLQYMNSQGTTFLYGLKGYAQAMRSVGSGEHPLGGVGSGAVDIINYYLIFANMEKHMPNQKCSGDLQKLVQGMSDVLDITLDETRLRSSVQERTRFAQLLDSMVENYETLQKRLELEAA